MNTGGNHVEAKEDRVGYRGITIGNDLKDTRDCGRTKGSSFKAAGQTRNRRGPG
jgi:hypothetical protein